MWGKTDNKRIKALEDENIRLNNVILQLRQEITHTTSLTNSLRGLVNRKIGSGEANTRDKDLDILREFMGDVPHIQQALAQQAAMGQKDLIEPEE